MANQDLQNSAQKMLKAMKKSKAGKSSAQPNIEPQAQAIDGEQQADSTGPIPYPRDRLLRQQNKPRSPGVDNEQAGPADPADGLMMQEAQKFAAPKKKAPSGRAASKSQAVSPDASSQGPSLESPPVNSQELSDQPANVNPARHSELLDEFGPQGSKVPTGLEDVPSPLEGGEGGGGMGGPMTVAALAAHMLLSPTSTGVGQGEDDIYSAKGTQLPQSVKPNLGPKSIGRSPQMQEDDAENLARSQALPHETMQAKNQRLAKEFASQLQQNFPDQISK